MPDHLSSPLPPAGPSAVLTDDPGWSMGPTNGRDVGLDARGSWLLEPDTGTGMLLYPRDWSFTERRDVAAHLKATGWSIVPTKRFLHLTSDGETVIRLLSQADQASPVATDGHEGRLLRLVIPAPDEQLEASN